MFRGQDTEGRRFFFLFFFFYFYFLLLGSCNSLSGKNWATFVCQYNWQNPDLKTFPVPVYYKSGDSIFKSSVSCRKMLNAIYSITFKVCIGTICETSETLCLDLCTTHTKCLCIEIIITKFKEI